MSEKDKQKKKASAEETAAQETAEQTAAPAEEAVQEETFTVTKSQMEQMEQLAKVLADANDKYLRLAAEYDNYRKRTTREKENVYGTAKADTIKPFLAVLDNLERGVQQFEEGDGHRQGLEMICKQFIDVSRRPSSMPPRMPRSRRRWRSATRPISWSIRPRRP